MKLKLAGASSSVELADAAFARDYNETLVHQVVTAYMAGARSGSKAQKTRAQVRGGGAKPWRQKGTGRARAGTIRSPIWVGGGRAFAAKKRDFSQKINRKMFRGAIASMISELARQGRLVMVEEFTVAEAKTKLVVAKLKELEVGESVLIIVEGFDRELLLGARNLPHVKVLEAKGVDPVSLARHERVVMTVPAAKLLEEQLS